MFNNFIDNLIMILSKEVIQGEMAKADALDMLGEAIEYRFEHIQEIVKKG